MGLNYPNPIDDTPDEESVWPLKKGGPCYFAKIKMGGIQCLRIFLEYGMFHGVRSIIIE